MFTKQSHYLPNSPSTRIGSGTVRRGQVYKDNVACCAWNNVLKSSLHLVRHNFTKQLSVEDVMAPANLNKPTAFETNWTLNSITGALPLGYFGNPNFSSELTFFQLLNTASFYFILSLANAFATSLSDYSTPFTCEIPMRIQFFFFFWRGVGRNNIKHNLFKNYPNYSQIIFNLCSCYLNMIDIKILIKIYLNHINPTT